MERTNNTSRITSLVTVSALVLIGVCLTYLFLGRNSYSQEDWLGTWEVSYYYDHEKELVYTGTLQLSLVDTLLAYLEIYPPKSTRPEKLSLEKLIISEDFRSISGQIVHKSYKISGGHVKEIFALNLEQGGAFNGQGECLAYCAEGTMGNPIIWTGNRSDLQ